MSEVQETPQEPTEPEAQPAAPAAPPNTWEQTLDARLAQRDAALVDMFNQTLTTVMDRLTQQQQPVQQQRMPDPEDEVTDQDFVNSPAAALKKFHSKKIEPLLSRLQQQPQQPDMNAAAGMLSMIELNKQKLQASMTPEEWNTYAPYFERSLQKANPQELINPDKMRMAYVIVKDHVDRSGVLQSDAEQKRINRNTSASLASAGGRQAKPAAAKVDLDEDEKRVIAGMGISPEIYNQYSDPKATFEPGGKVGA